MSQNLLCILTSEKKLINEEIAINFGGKRGSVGVLEIERNWSPFKVSDTDVGDDSLYDFDGEDEEENLEVNGSNTDHDEDGVSETWENNFPCNEGNKEEGEITPEKITSKNQFVNSGSSPMNGLEFPISSPVSNPTAAPQVPPPPPLQPSAPPTPIPVSSAGSPAVQPPELHTPKNSVPIDTVNPAVVQPTSQFPPFPFSTPFTHGVQHTRTSLGVNPAPDQQPIKSLSRSKTHKFKTGFSLRVSKGHSSGKQKHTCRKRRRISSPAARPSSPHVSSSLPTVPVRSSPEQSIDLNRASSPAIDRSVAAANVDSPTLSESKLTTQIGMKVGFQIEEDDRILKEIISGEGVEIGPQ